MSTPRHGGQRAAIATRFGVDVDRLIDFSASINPDGPPASVVAALHAALDRPETLTLYPDLEELRLKEALTLYAAVAPENLLVANGFVPLLDAALQVLRLRTCLMPVPCFVEYRTALERAGIQVLPVTLSQETGFRYDVDQLLSVEADSILLANPQNPTGALLDDAAMRRLVTEAGRRGTYVLLDEAFIDYAAENSLIDDVEGNPHLIVFRSVTKCFGMPGLRVAYAAAQQELRRHIQRALHPWSVSTLASIGTIAALTDTAFVATFRALNQGRRERFVQGLWQAGATLYEGAANSILLQFPQSESLWQRLIVDHHLLLRSCANFEGLPEGFLRVAVRSDEDNARLIHALLPTSC